MSSTYVVRDSLTLLRRNLVHLKRYPSLTIMLLAQPILILLLMVYVFGGSMGAGISGGGGGAGTGGSRADYLRYVVPVIVIMTVATVSLGTAIAVASDKTSGLISRLRTMDVSGVAVLSGHVLGALLKTMVALAAIVAFAVLLGYRSDAGLAGWLSALGLLLLLAFALTWLTVGMGLAADSVETASNTPMLLFLLPFVSSGFVPTATMPTGLRQFAEYQPFTPINEALRAFLAGEPAGSNGWIALAWCLALALVGFVWSRHLFARPPKAT